MIALLHAEIRKVARTRSLLVLAAGTAAYPVLAIAATASAPDGLASKTDPDALLAVVRGGADVAKVAVLLIAIIAVAGEYRHGTIVPTLLATPRRVVVVLGKIVALAATGLVITFVSTAVGLTVGRAYLASEGAAVGVSAVDLVLAVAGAGFVVTCYSAIGASLGWITRNQAGAIAVALIWLLAFEELVPVLLRRPGVQEWLPGGAAARLLRIGEAAPGTASVVGAGALLVASTGALAALALVRTVKTDIQ